MSPRRLPVDIPPEITEITRDVPAGLLGDSFGHACERFDRYIGARAVELASSLDLPVREELVIADLMAGRGWSDAGALALRWLLETLETYGRAEASDSRWRIDTLAADVASATVRDHAVAALPETAPAYRVFELSAATVGPVLRGEARGEDALFSPSTLGLWFEYFSNENPHYAINNTLAAAALAREVAAGARVLEVGGGGGSAAQAALAALVATGRPPSRYTFTELHPAFLRRGSRVVQAAAPPGCAVASMRYDIDADPQAQGLGDAGFDAVLAVNTLHLAADLVVALARLRSLLRPGGVIVLGELLRPGPTAGVHIELPFTLLEAYRKAPLVDGMRPRPGFLALQGWTHALRAAGFTRVSWLPERIARCVELYPGFYCGTLVAS